MKRIECWGKPVKWAILLGSPIAFLCLTILLVGIPWPLPDGANAYDLTVAKEMLEKQIVLYVVSLVSGLLSGVIFMSSHALQNGRILLHLLITAIACLFTYLLWVFPLWQFHHDWGVGLFAWFWRDPGIDGEYEPSFGPQPLATLLTLGVYGLSMLVLRRMLISRISRSEISEEYHFRAEEPPPFESS